VLVSVLVVAGCVLAPISVAGVWLHDTLLNTDHYVSTIGPVADNAAVQDALANRITNALVQGSQLDTKIKDALPPRASFVAPFLANGITQFVHTAALKVVQAPKFSQLWKTLNRRAHAQVVAVLRGEGKKINTTNGQVAINIGPVIDTVNQQLNKLGLNTLSKKVSAANREIVLFKSSGLHQAQSAVRLFDNLAIALPIITALLFAGAIALSLKRRRTVLRSALGLALAMVVLLTIFNVGRSIYLNALPASVNQPAAGAVYDQLLSNLLLVARTVLVFAVVIAVGAWLSGPARLATRIRTASGNLVRRAPGETVVSPRIATFVDRSRQGLRLGVVGVGLLILVLLNHPGPVAVLVVAVLVLLAVGVIELIRRGAPQPAEATRSAS
jgi:hypothetical protein